MPRAHAGDQDLNSLIDELRSLSLQEDSIRLKKDKLLERIASFGAARTAAPSPPRLKAGDRVLVLNEVKKPAIWTSTWNAYLSAQSRHATVVEVNDTNGRVTLQTDTGFRIWRLAKNLSPQK